MRITQDAETASGSSTVVDGGDPAIAASLDAFRRIVRTLRPAATMTRRADGLGAAGLVVRRALQDGAEGSLSEIAGRTMTDPSSKAAVIERRLAALTEAMGPGGRDPGMRFGDAEVLMRRRTSRGAIRR